MKHCLPLIALVILCSCGQRVSVLQKMDEATKTRDSLMRNESVVSGAFFRTRVFHEELMQLTTQRDAHPYPALDTTFHAMRYTANRVIQVRLNYDNYYHLIDSLSKLKKRISSKSDDARALQMAQAGHYGALSKSSQGVEMFQNENAMYHHLCKQHGIYSIPIADYAAMLELNISMWMDSLETVGRLIAAARLDLKQKFPEQKGEQFFAHYQPVSELEAQLKSFEGSIMQLQNSLSRMQGANQQDVFFYGPHIDTRREVLATETILGDLNVKMSGCREQYAVYLNGYK
ncbi:MAG: hypothetical protein ACKVOR_03420 [Flavobacteriales bacterium]